MLAVVALAVLVLLATGGDDDDIALDVRDDDASTTTTDESTTSTSTPTSVNMSASSTTGTVLVAEERCASNDVTSPDDLWLEACVVDRARAGQTVRVRIRASDGNAKVRDDCGSPFVDWGDSEQATCAIGCASSPGPSAPSSIDVTREHVYTEPGRYSLQVVVESSCGEEPFGDVEDVPLGIEVT